MRRERFGRGLWIGLAFVLLLPSLAAAQSTIAGVVKDTTGAVMPGVTVEASSPVLIEKVRSAVTDGDGRYAIVNLRPGPYVITFTLEGFNTVKREGIDVPANVSVPVYVEMKVGQKEETLTVTTEAPVVDVQNTGRVQVMSREIIDAVPNARNIQSIAALVPGVRLTVPDVGGSQQMEQTYMMTHGNLSVHNTVQIDGMIVNTMFLDGQVQNYVDNSLVQEATYQTSGVSAEVSAGGVRVNMIPKDGGNTLHGSGFLGLSPGSWQSSNLVPDLQARGARSGNRIEHIQDFNLSLGGPIVRDKLWFFLSGRYQSTNDAVPNSFYDADPGPAYVADASRPGVQDQWIRSMVGRVTWQLNAKNKISALWQQNWKFKGHEIQGGGQGVFTPQDPSTAATRRDPRRYIIGQLKWTSPITQKLLLEAGYSNDTLYYTNVYEPGINKDRGTPEWFSTATHVDTITGLRSVAGMVANEFFPIRHDFSGSATYVTGSHNFKAGFQDGFGTYAQSSYMNGDLQQEYQNGRPFRVRVYNTPVDRSTAKIKTDLGLYLQDMWSVNKLTVSAGVRWEYFEAFIPAQSREAGRFAPARDYPEVNCSTNPGMTCWKSWAPRLGLNYDVFGNGKTALKASFGKYMRPQAELFANLFNPYALVNETRTWTDTDLQGRVLPTNGDDVAQDNEIGPGNPNFGRITNRTLDPNYQREFNLQYSAGIQHQIRPGWAASFNWFRRSLHNARFTDNYAININSDWTPFTVVNPLTGELITAYNLNRAKLTATPDIHLSNASDDNLKRIYNGFEVATSARIHRANVFAGWTMERTIDVHCNGEATGENFPYNIVTNNDPNTYRFCDARGNSMLGEPSVSIPFTHEFKLAANVPIWRGFEMSAALQSYLAFPALKGVQWTITSATTYPADCTVPGCTPGARVAPNLVQPALTIPLVGPGTRLMDRLTQVDLGIKRTFKVSNMQLQAQVDVFNALNNHAVLAENQALGTTSFSNIAAFSDGGPGGTPAQILQPRIFRVGLQLKF